jgi:hypothetical protein
MQGASTRRYVSIVEEMQRSRRAKIGGLTTGVGWVYGPANAEGQSNTAEGQAAPERDW